MQQQSTDSSPKPSDETKEPERTASESDKAKCPVPRPILNILMKNRRPDLETAAADGPAPRDSTDAGEKDRRWIADQIAVFRESYESIPGYDSAEAYLECILNLATGGVESPRVKEVGSLWKSRCLTRSAFVTRVDRSRHVPAVCGRSFVLWDVSLDCVAFCTVWVVLHRSNALMHLQHSAVACTYR